MIAINVVIKIIMMMMIILIKRQKEVHCYIYFKANGCNRTNNALEHDRNV